VIPGAPFYKTDERIRSKRAKYCTSQSAIAAELIVGHDGKRHIQRTEVGTQATSKIATNMTFVYIP